VITGQSHLCSYCTICRGSLLRPAANACERTVRLPRFELGTFCSGGQPKMPSLWVSIDQRLTGTLISANSPPFGWVFGRAEARGEDALLATVGEIVGMSQDQIRVCPACCRDRGIRAQDGSPRTGNRSCASPRTPGIPCRSDWSRRRRAWSQPPVVEVNYVTISSLGSFDRRGIVRRVTSFTCFIWRKARVSRGRPRLSNIALEASLDVPRRRPILPD
jgi:hypothetical protein